MEALTLVIKRKKHLYFFEKFYLKVRYSKSSYRIFWEELIFFFFLFCLPTASSWNEGYYYLLTGRFLSFFEVSFTEWYEDYDFLGQLRPDRNRRKKRHWVLPCPRSHVCIETVSHSQLQPFHVLISISFHLFVLCFHTIEAWETQTKRERTYHWVCSEICSWQRKLPFSMRGHRHRAAFIIFFSVQKSFLLFGSDVNKREGR